MHDLLIYCICFIFIHLCLYNEIIWGYTAYVFVLSDFWSNESQPAKIVRCISVCGETGGDSVTRWQWLWRCTKFFVVVFSFTIFHNSICPCALCRACVWHSHALAIYTFHVFSFEPPMKHACDDGHWPMRTRLHWLNIHLYWCGCEHNQNEKCCSDWIRSQNERKKNVKEGRQTSEVKKNMRRDKIVITCN